MTIQELAERYGKHKADVIEGDYRGMAMLILRESPLDKFPFQFGIRNARLMLANLPEIVKFVEERGRAEKMTEPATL